MRPGTAASSAAPSVRPVARLVARLVAPRLARRGRQLAAGLAVVGLIAVLGCRHRGGEWSSPPRLSSAPVDVFILGQPRAAASTRAVAEELAGALDDARAAGHGRVIVWLGTDFGPPGPERAGACPDPQAAFSGPGLSELVEVIDRAEDQGATVWGLPGPDGWRCGQSGLEPEPNHWTEALPYRQPGLAYVLRVHADGAVELGSSCDGPTCTLTPTPAPEPGSEPGSKVLAELVLLELSPWNFPDLASAATTELLEDQQASLLAALAAQPAPASQPSVPRLLLSPIPVESAGARGLGGRKQRTAFHYLPASVQAALAEGLFAGAIGALERDQQVSVDISNAIVRGDRSFVDKPIFAVVTGAAGGGNHALPTSRGRSLLPDLHTEHTGFVRLGLGETTAQLQVYARVNGRWRVAAYDLPLRPPVHPPLREAPVIHPCPSCDPQRGAGDVEVFVPRTERPR